MKNMTQAEVREVKNTFEGSLTSKPVYDLAVIDSVLWRVGVVDTDKNLSKLKTLCKRLDIPMNSQGFRGTALSFEGNAISKKFIHKINDADRPPRASRNWASRKSAQKA